MKLGTKIVALAFLGSMASASVFAGDVTYDFRSSNNGTDDGEVNFSGSGFGNSATITDASGLNVTITAWSNTQDVNGPDRVQNARLANNGGDGGGLLVFNRDEGSNDFSTNPCDGHCIDNRNDTTDGDTDFVLFSFNHAVSLTELFIGYYEGGPDISIAAFASMPNFIGRTLGNIASNSNTNLLYKNSLNNVGNFETLNLTSGGQVVESQYWLVSAYHSVFGFLDGDQWNDAFKFKGLTVHRQMTPPSDADAPPMFIALCLALAALVYRRKVR